jgi:hypothetical protein
LRKALLESTHAINQLRAHYVDLRELNALDFVNQETIDKVKALLAEEQRKIW